MNPPASTPPDVNLWSSAEHALEYLRRADSIPHRTEGEATLLEFLPKDAKRILDLGTGDGRLLALVKSARPEASFVGLDFSPAMLERVRSRYGSDGSITIVAHDLENKLPALGHFDAVISSFAIHHVSPPQRRALYQDIFEALEPGGFFCNLEHVASSTPRLHDEFLSAIGRVTDDPSNKLLPVETQLAWLREIGFEDVDCHWKWREFAFFAGTKPKLEAI